MRAVISVIGADRVGILAKISGRCAENNINIIVKTIMYVRFFKFSFLFISLFFIFKMFLS